MRGRPSSPTSRSSTTIRRASSRTRRRQHRWVRGDWQILWWLFPFVPSRTGLQRNRLPLVSRWKILDNLRRSLMAPATVAAAPPRLDRPAGLSGRVDGDRSRRGRVAGRVCGCSSCSAGRHGWNQRRRSCEPPSKISTPTSSASRLQLAFLANQAYEMLHAITVTLVRLGITKHRLLEWETAAASADRGGPPRLSVFVKDMIASPLIAVGGLALVVLVRPQRAARGGAGPRAVGGGAAHRVRAQPPGADAPCGARRGGPRVSPVGGAQDVAVLRDVRRSRRITRSRPTTSRSSRT